MRENLAERIKKAVDCWSYVAGRMGVSSPTSRKRYPCPLCGGSGFSFYSKGSEKLWKCHSCGKGGDVIDFEMEESGSGFRDACESICRREGLPIKERRERRPPRKSAIPAPESPDWREILAGCDPAALEESLERWLEGRGFGDLAAPAARVAREKCAGIHSHMGHPSFVFPGQDAASGETVGVQRIACAKDASGKTPKFYGRGSNGKMVLPFDVSPEGPLVLVESIANALALAAAGISSVCLYSKCNADLALPLKERFPGRGMIFWLDRGAEKDQRAAMEKAEAGGIFFAEEKPGGYDVNDLLGDCGNAENFAACARGMLASAEIPEPKRSPEARKVLEILMRAQAAQASEDAESAENAVARALAGSKISLVEIPTGGGKTTAAAKLAKESLLNGKTMLYCAALKSDMHQFAETLGSILSQEEKEQHAPRISIISSDSGDEIGDHTRLLVTHRTYLSRKGFSTLHYSPLIWIEKSRPLLVIDEAEEYAASQQFWLDAGCRFGVRSFRGTKRTRHEVMQKCRAFAGRGSCDGCELSRCSYLEPNPYATLVVRPHVPGLTGASYPPVDLGETIPLNNTEAQFKTLRVQDVHSRRMDLGERRYRTCYERGAGGEVDEPGAKDIIGDMLACAHQPRMYETTPLRTMDGEPADPGEIAVKIRIAKEGGAKYDPSTKYSFPGSACEVRRYCLWDMSALAFAMRNARKTLLLNAPMDAESDERAFLESCAERAGGKLEAYRAGEIGHRLERLCVFIALKPLACSERNLKETLAAMDADENALWFASDQGKARDAYSQLPQDFPAALQSREGWQRTETDRAKESGCRVSLTYPCGPMGRGINRPFDRVCFVDTRIYQPGFTLRPGATLDETEIERAQVRKTTSRTRQCGGRILRVNPDHPANGKAIVAHGVGDAKHIDLGALAANFGSMAKEVSFVVAESEDWLWFALAEYLRTGKPPDKSEAQWLAEMDAAKPTNMVTESRRDNPGRKEAREEFKQKRTADRLEKRVREMAAERIPWEVISRELKIKARYENLESKLRQDFEDERRK